MFGVAAAFLVIAVVAAVAGYADLAGMSLNVSWILFLFGLVFAAVLSFPEGGDRKPRPDRHAKGHGR